MQWDDIFIEIKYKFANFISVPPNKPIIRDENGKKMSKTLGPYKIGDKLFATCSTTGGTYMCMILIVMLIYYLVQNSNIYANTITLKLPFFIFLVFF